MKLDGKIKGNISMKNLMIMLQAGLEKEEESWEPIFYVDDGENVGRFERDEKVLWFLHVNTIFNCNPETIALSTAIFDYFMSTVKVKSKYAECIAISCLFLAMKTMEEDEMIPSTFDLVEKTGCSCSAFDVLRMEKIILQKLNWNTKLVTAMDFLHIMHGLLLLNHSSITRSPGQQLSSLTRKLHQCLTNHQILVFKPSSISLALLSLELQLCTRDWLALTLMMQNHIKLESGELIRCRETISEILSAHQCAVRKSNISFTTASKRGISPINKPSKRKVQQIEVDDIYDSIKKLYAEDYQSNSSCSTQAADQTSKSVQATSPNFFQVSAT